MIGDLHGCYKEARQLLEKCEYDPTKDRVIFVGDLIDRGPDNDLCIEFAQMIQTLQDFPSAILGNHEEKHLFYRSVDEEGREHNHMHHGHAKTREQLQDSHYDFLKSLPLFVRLPEFNMVCVHAGVYPGRSIENQSKSHLLHIQSINPENFPEISRWPSKIEGQDGWKFWTHFWDGPETIVFGHSVLSEPLITKNAIGIDGGACFGLKLYALVMPDMKIVSVDSNEPKAKRGKTYQIHDQVMTY